MSRDNITNGAIMNALIALPIRMVVPPAKSTHHMKSLGLRVLCVLKDFADAWAIYCHRLFHEDMLLLIHRILEVFGTEVGRCGQDHDIDTGVDDLLEGIEADEPSFGIHLHLPTMAIHQIAVTRGQSIIEGISHGPESYAAVGSHGLSCSTGAATATADQSDLDGVASLYPTQSRGGHRRDTECRR